MSSKYLGWAMQQRLPCPQKFLLFVMADNTGLSGWCEMPATHLRERCGLTRRSYDAAVTMLQKKHLIHEVAPGRHQHPRYAMNLQVQA